MNQMNPITLSQLTQGIARAMEDAFRDMRFWVIADVTNHTFRAEKGYHNFELVEKGGASASVIAKIAGKAWGKGSARIAAFEEATGQRFTSNIHVLVQVALEYHPVYGISASVIDIDSSFTLGQLEQQRAATLQRLVAQNDFIRKAGEEYHTANKGLQLNSVLQRIALLSSSISAGAEDFRHTLLNNPYGYTYTIDDYFASVQGDQNAIKLRDKLVDIFNSGIAYDAVVILRGGGAQTDFLIFDNYHLARAVAKFPVPVITGIGHQKDQSITDLMAHTQTKTPTKAAEFIIAHNRGFEEKLFLLQKKIIIKAQQLVASAHSRTEAKRSAVVSAAQNVLSGRRQGLSGSRFLLASAPRQYLLVKGEKLSGASMQVLTRPRLLLGDAQRNLALLEAGTRRSVSEYLSLKRSGLLKNSIASGLGLSAIMNRLSGSRELLRGKAQQLAKSSGDALLAKDRELTGLSVALRSGPRISLNNGRNDLAEKLRALEAAVQQHITGRKNNLESRAMAVRMMAPENILRKGYAIIRKDDGIVSDPGQIQPGDTIDIILKEEIVTSIVKHKSNNTWNNRD